MTKSGNVQTNATDAANSCDNEEIRAKLGVICQALTEIQTAYDELVCQLDILECLPDAETTLFPEVRAKLEQTGVHVAGALWALNHVVVEDDAEIERLRSGWHAICLQAGLLQCEIIRFAQSQLCPPPNNCQDAVTRLLAYTREGVQRAAALSHDQDGGEAFDWQRALINSVQEELVRISGQAANLAGFDQQVFDPFWWSIVEIRQILFPCPEEDRCLLTEQQLTQAIEELKNRFAPLGATICAPPAPFGSRRTSVPAQSNPVITSAPGAAYYLEMWKRSEDVALQLGGRAPAALKPQLESLASQAQLEQRRLQTEMGAGGTISTELSQWMERRLNEVYTALETARAISPGSTSGVEQRRLERVQAPLVGSR